MKYRLVPILRLKNYFFKNVLTKSIYGVMIPKIVK